MLKLVMLGFVLLFGSAGLTASAYLPHVSSVSDYANSELSEMEKVHRLIQFIRTMKDATFIRNGSEHTCQEAADHLQSKWEKHKNKITSASAFIEELASKSGFSGEPYKIKFKNGKVFTTNAVLMQELKRLESL